MISRWFGALALNVQWVNFQINTVKIEPYIFLRPKMRLKYQKVVKMGLIDFISDFKIRSKIEERTKNQALRILRRFLN